MAGPDALAEHLLAAIQAGDWAAFHRWTRHPRWRADHARAQSWALAALEHPTEAWVKALDEAGVAVKTTAVFHRALTTGQTAAVEWLLANGARPTQRLDYGLGPSLAWTALERIGAGARAEDLVAMHRYAGTWVGLFSVQEHARMLAHPNLPLVLDCLVREGWRPEDPDGEDSPEGLAGLARKELPSDHPLVAWLNQRQLDQRLKSAPKSVARVRL